MSAMEEFDIWYNIQLENSILADERGAFKGGYQAGLEAAAKVEINYEKVHEACDGDVLDFVDWIVEGHSKFDIADAIVFRCDQTLKAKADSIRELKE